MKAEGSEYTHTKTSYLLQPFMAAEEVSLIPKCTRQPLGKLVNFASLRKKSEASGLFGELNESLGIHYASQKGTK
jgi:hypothetical protein